MPWLGPGSGTSVQGHELGQGLEAVVKLESGIPSHKFRSPNTDQEPAKIKDPESGSHMSH